MRRGSQSSRKALICNPKGQNQGDTKVRIHFKFNFLKSVSLIPFITSRFRYWSVDAASKKITHYGCVKLDTNLGFGM